MPGMSLIRLWAMVWFGSTTGCGPCVPVPQDGDVEADADVDVGADGEQGESCHLGETRESYSGQVGTAGVGMCQLRIETCVVTEEGNAFQVTQDEVIPTAEIIGNGVDEDCDGFDAPCSLGDVRESYSGPAETSGVGLCQPTRERCEVTEAGFQYQILQAEVLPSDEVPNNGIDENCDGFDDECVIGERWVTYSGPGVTANVGACQDRIVECQETDAGARRIVVQEEVLPSDEICDDGIDNDCRGLTFGERWRQIYYSEAMTSIQALQITDDGGMIAAGYGYVGREGQESWLLRVDAEGEMIWSRHYGGYRHEGFNAVSQTSDGGFVAAGYTNSLGSYGQIGYNGWMVRVDGDGTELWRHTYGGMRDDYFYALQITEDDGLLAAGEVDALNGDGWLVRTDAAGVQQWSTSFTSTEFGYFNSILPREDGSFVVSGTVVPEGEEYEDGWLVRVDGEGVQEWSQTYHFGDSLDRFFALQPVSGGGFIAAGDTYPGYGWLARMGEDGGQLWGFTYGAVSYYGRGGFMAVQVASDGSIVAGGDKYTSDGLVGLLVRTDADGAELISQTFVEGGDDHFYALQTATDGGVIAAGRALSLVTAYSSGWIIKFCLE